MNIDHFREKLLREKGRLEAELKPIGKRVGSAEVWEAKNTVVIDPADDTELADKFEELGINESVIANLEVQHKEIIEALKKIENNNYGICEVGGEPIEEDRLEANPAARTCKAHMNEKPNSQGNG